MAKVSINIIKDWFKNQMKPPQEQFWSWLDSFWHKDEPIPQSAVENLVTTLQKKADLVNGVVPESQLPFSVVTSEVIALGVVSVTTDKINLAVHSSGSNRVRVKGKTISRSFPNEWTFTPIIGTGFKVLRGYAVKYEDDFFVAESAELEEITDPEIPENALEIFKITLSSLEEIIDTGIIAGNKLKAEDGFRSIVVSGAEEFWIPFDIPQSMFQIFRSSFLVAPIITGFIDFPDLGNVWNGKRLFVKNSTGADLLLKNIGPAPLWDNKISFNQDYTVKIGEIKEFIFRNGEFELLELVPGSDDTKLDKPLSPNNTADRLIEADGGTTAKGNYQRSKQFFVSLPATVLEDWKGCIVIFTSSGNLTVPTGLSSDFYFDGKVDNGVTLTPAITGPMAWLGTAPAAFNGKAIFVLMRRDGSNNFEIDGI